MKTRILFSLLLLLPAAVVLSKSIQQKLDKAAFYEVMDRGKLDEVEKEIEIVTNLSLPEKDGYIGALLMRKADLQKLPAQRLKSFKAGRIKFDPAIAADAGNVEFHFLRLAIQEHAPKIVKYNKDIEADKKAVIKGYKDQSPAVQHAIMDYTKKSKVLLAADLK
ncbi:hypothetical protein ACFS5N_04810 [Mucilaginibacter ximonensis]|uniref:DUF4142 domain-containing protein n=1 Tax=Mucilaginibacter ximonensis TaxID=538021 RepID=A0ABW5Y9R9_9SPHI